jgi:hypothetical protein
MNETWEQAAKRCGWWVVKPSASFPAQMVPDEALRAFKDGFEAARSGPSSAEPMKKPPCGWMPWNHLVQGWLNEHGELAPYRAADLWDRIAASALSSSAPQPSELK